MLARGAGAHARRDNVNVGLPLFAGSASYASRLPTADWGSRISREQLFKDERQKARAPGRVGVFCGQCGQRNPDGARYCVKCGAALDAPPGALAPAASPASKVDSGLSGLSPAITELVAKPVSKLGEALAVGGGVLFGLLGIGTLVNTWQLGNFGGAAKLDWGSTAIQSCAFAALGVVGLLLLPTSIACLKRMRWGRAAVFALPIAAMPLFVVPIPPHLPSPHPFTSAFWVTLAS